MALVRITEDDMLVPGDIVQIHGRLVGGTWLRAAQVALLESKIGRKYKNFKILSISTEEDRIVFRAEVVQPVDPETGQLQEASVAGAAIITTICAIVLSLTLWFTVTGIFKEVKEVIVTPGGQIALGGAGLAAIGAVVLLLLSALKK